MAVGSVTSGRVVNSATLVSTSDSPSPVQRRLQEQNPPKTEEEKKSYTEQDWYIRAKVSQLRTQIFLYSNLPGLDPSGLVMDSLTKQVNELVVKQQEKIAAARKEAEEKQAILDADAAAKANAPLTAEALLERAKMRADGIEPPIEVTPEAQALLDKVRGTTVDQTA